MSPERRRRCQHGNDPRDYTVAASLGGPYISHSLSLQRVGQPISATNTGTWPAPCHGLEEIEAIAQHGKPRRPVGTVRSKAEFSHSVSPQTSSNTR